jgi:hypothetical protein
VLDEPDCPEPAGYRLAVAGPDRETFACRKHLPEAEHAAGQHVEGYERAYTVETITDPRKEQR